MDGVDRICLVLTHVYIGNDKKEFPPPFFVLWREEGELGSSNVTNVTTLGQSDGSS